jgi:phospholipid-binding lipoprotein MlaA
MKSYLSVILAVVILLTTGFVHGQETLPATTPPDLSASQQVAPSPETGVDQNVIDQSQTTSNDPADEINDEYREDVLDAYTNNNIIVEIADPLEPVNRVMHGFNDKLYFWALKPVAQGYKAVLPEPARLSVKNFFSNLAFPARFLSCLLQADFSGAATEAGRFAINTLWGIGGLLDPSSGKELNLQKQETDLGQTLGVWGVGQGFYIVWPVFGPSSPRDTATLVGDYFLYPVAYINPWYASVGVRTYEEVNATSLRIGDYEALKDAAIDPYVAFRDAYAQYRFKKIKARKAKTSSSAPVKQQEQPAAAIPER